MSVAGPLSARETLAAIEVRRQRREFNKVIRCAGCRGLVRPENMEHFDPTTKCVNLIPYRAEA